MYKALKGYFPKFGFHYFQYYNSYKLGLNEKFKKIETWEDRVFVGKGRKACI